MLMLFAAAESWIWPVLAGPFIGSLVGVLVRRLPLGRPVVLGRSACESCNRVLGPAELVPIASYLWLRGRCAGCGSRIAPQHLQAELLATGLAAWAAWAGLRGPALWAGCGFGWALLALAWIDWRHFRLPDVLTLPLLLAGLGVAAWQDPPSVPEHAMAAAVGYALFRLVDVAYRRLRGRAGLGEGDAKLMAALGAWLGLQGSAHTLLVAAVLGLAFGLARLPTGRQTASAAIPFGPFLAVAGWVTWLYSL